MKSSSQVNHIEPAQLSYATLLVWLVRYGLMVMFVFFLPYATGWVPAAIPIGEVPSYWTVDASTYAQAVGMAAGWQWVRFLGDSGVLAFVGTILFPMAATIAALAAAAFFARDRVAVYSFIALAETAVLVVAATGILTGA
ncbi:MAG: hypothetical protein V3S41_08120 [Spirochaetia bacterium]